MPSDISPYKTEQFLHFSNRAAWRRWLQKNYATHPGGVWLLFYKKATGIPSVSLAEATEEAICFGWIDGRLRRIDDEKHKIKFVPRRKNSVWSLVNKTRAERLIETGKMMPAGLEKIEEAKKNGNWDNAYSTSRPQPIPPELVAAMTANLPLQQAFNSLSPSMKYQYIFWINQAKTGTTRARRIEKVIELSTQTK
jgi:uncharacterized protein YdeI (YjbR/CyaY-like superfamily)